MKIGEVYEVNTVSHTKITVRVLAFDEIEVFYDTQQFGSEWFFDNKKTFIFTRLSVLFFKENSHLIGETQITQNNSLVFCSELPLRLLRSRAINWTDVQDEEPFDDDVSLPITEIYLVPYGAKGGFQKPVLIKSKLAAGFSNNELYHLCFSLQKVKLDDRKGIGIYRSGSKNGIPSYYIGGFDDLAGNTKMKRVSIN